MSNEKKITTLEYKYKEKVYDIIIKEIKNFIEIYCGTEKGEYYYFKIDVREINYGNPYEDINLAFTKEQVIFKKNNNDELEIHLPYFFYNLKEYATSELKKIINTKYYDIGVEKNTDRINLSIIMKDKKVYKFEFNKEDLEAINLDINENGENFKKLIEDKCTSDRISFRWRS